MFDLQQTIGKFTTLFIYCLFVWLIWTLITSIATSYGQPGWGMVAGAFGCSVFLLYLYFKNNYGDD